MSDSTEVSKQLLAALPGEIERVHAAAIGSAKRALENAVECGRLLSQAKATVGYGIWENWADKHLSFGARQARKYMALYKRREGLLRNSDSEPLTIEGALAYLRDIGEYHPPMPQTKSARPKMPASTVAPVYTLTRPDRRLLLP